ncbi:MAG: tetratricopeptide repeat protein [Treponema sp.]|jgi:tetratricopeptide (TPR) repeat protein|nr:tetratricopeptide repeat protein [Treponema sp.]
MTFDPVLTKAARLARSRNYDGAIKLLEPEVNRYYGSFTYYYLLGVSYLYAQIFGMALSYFRLAREQKMRDPSVLLGLAVLHLNHGDTDKALDLYLEVQELDENNKTAKRALKIIRKHPGPENIAAWIDSGKLPVLFPPLPKVPLSPARIRAAVLIALLIAGAAAGVRIAKPALPFGAGFTREEPKELGLHTEERDAPMQIDGSYRYVLTRKEVVDKYNEARKLFASYRDEKARVNLNHLLESNSPEPVKNKARILLSYLEVPGFDTLKDRFSYGEVIKEPALYRDCHIIWRGIAGNLNIEQNHTSFDFLVGYDTRRTIEGIVRVDYDFAIPVNPEQPVEILGRIVPFLGEKGPEIRIAGVALNQAGLLDQEGAQNQDSGASRRRL